jgi:hypothetical protein
MRSRQFLAVSLFVAAPLCAQNIVSNPSFVSDLSDWTFPSYDTANWEPFSRTGGTGSAHVTSLVRPGTLDAPNTSAEQCVEVIPGRTYVSGGHVYVPGDVAPTEVVSPFVDTRFFAGSSCEGSILLQLSGSADPRRDTWLGVQTVGVAPAGAGSARVAVGALDGAGSAAVTSIEVFVDDAFALLDRTCADTETDLCLNGGRFRVSGSFRVPAQDRSGPAHALHVTEDSGLFWFFERNNLEVFVKVLSACGLPSHNYWVFAAGLTDVEVNLVVVDTVSGQERTYFNSSGTAFAPIQDTSAFATCP